MSSGMLVFIDGDDGELHFEGRLDQGDKFDHQSGAHHMMMRLMANQQALEKFLHDLPPLRLQPLPEDSAHGLSGSA